MSEEKTGRKWGAETYSKWDKVDEFADGEESRETGTLPTSFDPGANKLQVKETLHLNETIEAKEGRIKGLKQESNDIWQVVVRKLRVWSASSTDEPCRPYSIFISSLYPAGQLLGQHICDPPEQYPEPAKVLECVVATMLNPLHGEQRRPRLVTFSDEALASELFRSLERWKVEASQLSESEGIDELVLKFSELLVKKDFANVGPTSEKPGCLAVNGVSVKLLQALFSTATRFAQAEPWAHLQERRAFQLELKTPVKTSLGNQTDLYSKAIQPGKVWVSVFGNENYSALKRGSQSLKPGDGAFGVAVFFSKLDLEARLLLPGEELASADNVERCSYTGKTKSQLGHELKRTKPRKVDIRTGEELMYADNEALRKHWPSVKKYVMNLDEVEEGRKQRRAHWLGVETTVLFEDITYLPFDDLDAIEKHGLAIPKPGTVFSLGRCVYPLALQFKQGEPDRPTPEHLVWLEFAMNLILTVQRDQLMSSILSSPDMPVTISTQAVQEGNVELFVKPSPVLFQSDIHKEQQQDDSDLTKVATQNETEQGVLECEEDVEQKKPESSGCYLQ